MSLKGKAVVTQEKLGYYHNKIKALLSGKQDTLESGTNIKTVNGNSMLGSGDIEVGDAADSYFSTTSTNPVQNKVVTAELESLDTRITTVNNAIGDLSTLTTANQTSMVSAVNELKFGLDGLGEPFRVKQWASNTLNVEIPCCTEDIGNTSIAKMVYAIDDVEGADYQIVGMIAYEAFDAASGGSRINIWPVCQFTGNGQKELSVRWMCGGTTRKTARRINAWVLLKHR